MSLEKVTLEFLNRAKVYSGNFFVIKFTSMKKWFFLFFIVPVFCLAQEKGLEKVVESFLQKSLSSKAWQIKEMKYVFDKRVGLYVVALRLKEGEEERPVLLYVSRKLDLVILGKIYDAKTGEELSKAHYLNLMGELPFFKREIDLKSLNLRGPVLGQGEAVILISNPNCPHCRELVPQVIKRVRERGGFSLYYKGVFFGKDHTLEGLIECVRQKKPEVFWDFVLQCYSSSQQKAIDWLSKRLGKDFVQGCKGEEIEEALKRDDLEAKEKMRISGIPAVLFKGKLYEGTNAILQVLFGRENQR